MNRIGARERGAILLLATLILVTAIGFVFAMALGSPASEAMRMRTTERALAQAREALLAYAADRPINTIVGPGYLPCPDLDNDGWAEPTCGSLSGDSGQQERLARLPWKTLGLPDLRDGDGERLWYAVSTRYKGLLNCAASAACVDMTPASAAGTITVRAQSGFLVHDGTGASGAVAVVLAPGEPLERAEPGGSRLQRRLCDRGDCDDAGTCVATPPQRAGPCDPRNFLDVAIGAAYSDEDNADFVDRSDESGRTRNGNGFI